jgi:small subunit ribosomal protein S4
VSIDGRKVTIPGYIVKRSEEEKIAFNSLSPISNELHPLRTSAQPAGKVPEAPAARSAEHLNSQAEKVEKTLRKVAADADIAEDSDLPEVAPDVKEE